MGGGRKARQDTLLGEEKGASANREDGSLSGGVSLLKVCKIGNEAQGLSLSLEDLRRVASKNDKDIKVVKTVMSVLEGDLGANHGALAGQYLGLRRGNGDFESLCVFWWETEALAMELGRWAAVPSTWVFEVVACSCESLKGTGKVHEVELWVKGKEHINGLIGRDSRGLVGSHDEDR